MTSEVASEIHSHSFFSYVDTCCSFLSSEDKVQSEKMGGGRQVPRQIV